MDKFGYARVSSISQNLDRQIEALEQAGCQKIIKEKRSGKNIGERPELLHLLDLLREDDELVVVSLDRISRDYDDIQSIVKELRDKGVKLTVLDMPYLNSNTNNEALDKMLQDLFLSVMGFVSQNEREKIRERQRQGIELAKKKGKYKGKKVVYGPKAKNKKNRLVYEKVCEELDKDTPILTIANSLGISRQTVYNIKKRRDDC